MPISPEALYVQLGRLAEEMPNLTKRPIAPDTFKWLGRLYALYNMSNKQVAIALHSKTTRLIDATIPSTVHELAQQISYELYRELAVAELEAPAAAQGTFIPAGNAFDALAAMSKLLGTATNDVLIVDPYMDEKALTDFVPLAKERVTVRLLADQQYRKPTLQPAVQRWVSQYGAVRPLEAKLSPARSLHDRLIMIDRDGVWVLTQSLNALAARSPASIIRVDGETASLKHVAYEAAWSAATLCLWPSFEARFARTSG